MFGYDEAEYLLYQARTLCDQGSDLKKAERIAREALDLINRKRYRGGGASAALLLADASLLLGRSYRALGRLDLAHIWLVRAWEGYGSLPRASNDLYIRTRMSECSNHMTLIAISDLQSCRRAVRIPPPQLVTQVQMLVRIAPEVREDHQLEAIQRWADYLRFCVSNQDAADILKRESYLNRAENMWAHNRSHRLMFQALLEMRTNHFDESFEHLSDAKSLPITFDEPSLEILWHEKMIELLQLTGDNDGIERHLERFRILRDLRSKASAS